MSVFRMPFNGDFSCCYKCRPPKRYPGCQDHCTEGQAAKAAFEAKKAARDKKARVKAGIYLQKRQGVERAARKSKRK